MPPTRASLPPWRYDQFIGRENFDIAAALATNAYQRFSGKLLYTRARWAGFRLYAQGTWYPGTGSLDEVSLLSGTTVLVAPQPKVTFAGDVKIPITS